MDFTKFVSLLEKKALYFARSDRFSDKFEGATPKPSIKAREASVLESGTPLIEEVSKGWSQASREIRKCMFLNCWHMNIYESLSIWQLYVQKSKGISIRSTF